MTLLLMSASHCTTPLNFDIPAFTLTMLELTSTELVYAEHSRPRVRHSRLRARFNSKNSLGK